MSRFALVKTPSQKRREVRLELAVSKLQLLILLLFVPLAAQAQGSPFDTGFNAIQTLFTGTIAKVASLVAIVIGGYGFAHGEPGAKKALAGVAAGTGIAVLAVNVLSWLWAYSALPSHRQPALRRGSYARQSTAEAPPAFVNLIWPLSMVSFGPTPT